MRQSLNDAQMPVILIGSGILALVILLVVFLFRGGDVDAGKLEAFEQRMVRMESVSEDLALIEEKLGRMESRINDLEMQSRAGSGDLPGTVADLEKKMDHLQRQILQAGAKTDSPVSAAASPGKKTLLRPPSEAAPAVKRPAEKKRDLPYHTVSGGDTLYSISRRYGLTVEELRGLNNLKPGDPIHPDQKLVIRR